MLTYAVSRCEEDERCLEGRDVLASEDGDTGIKREV
jgi:hypothetical protein